MLTDLLTHSLAHSLTRPLFTRSHSLAHSQKQPIGGKSFLSALVDSVQNPDWELANPCNSSVHIGVHLLKKAPLRLLTRNMRAVLDPEFAAEQEKMRSLDPDDFEDKLRFLESVPVLSADDWTHVFAFCLVGTCCNFERAYLNQQIGRAFARYFNRPVVRWLENTTAVNGQAGESLAHHPNLRTDAGRRRFLDKEPGAGGWFVVGAPLIVTYNIDSRQKLVNGTPGLFHSLVFEGGAPPEYVHAMAAGEYCEVVLSQPPSTIVVIVGTGPSQHPLQWHGQPLPDLTGVLRATAVEAMQAIPLSYSKESPTGGRPTIVTQAHTCTSTLAATMGIRNFVKQTHGCEVYHATTDFKVCCCCRCRCCCSCSCSCSCSCCSFVMLLLLSL